MQMLCVAFRESAIMLQARTVGLTPLGTEVSGERARLTIKNVQEPNPADPNDPARVLNITVRGRSLRLRSHFLDSFSLPANNSFM
jgi:hypothetical protein